MNERKRLHLDVVGDVTAAVVTVGVALVLIFGAIGAVVWTCRWMLTVVRGVCP